MRRWFTTGIFILALGVSAYSGGGGPTMTLVTASGGVAVSGNAASFGTVNGLGVGWVPGSVPALVTSGVSNGVFYLSPVSVTIAFNGAHTTGSLKAYASTNFLNTSVLSGYVCTLSCTTYSSYSALPLTSTGAKTLFTGVGSTTVTFYVGVFVSNINGASALNGGDSIQITLTGIDGNNGQSTPVVLTVSVTVQKALQLTLSDPNGLISAASDYVMNFQGVNGLGINPSPNISSMTVSGGAVYYIPYTLTPVFAGFKTTTTGSLWEGLGTPFNNPSIIYLEDSAVAAGPYAAFPASVTKITGLTPVASNTPVNRYLGLFVSNYNGSLAYTGPDTSTVIFQLTAP